MTIYKFGDVILVPFPFTNQTTSKKRPAVVVSSDIYNSQYADSWRLILILIPCYLKHNLTPQPPSLQGKGEYISPLLAGEGLGERSYLLLTHNSLLSTPYFLFPAIITRNNSYHQPPDCVNLRTIPNRIH
ncbi:MAG: type II toxin-antitoxin system PemK/MazF family toxin [Trichodesmium sp.]